MTETENKKFENERYLYCRGRIYTPYTFKKPKLDEKGYFTNDLEAFVNFEDPELEYIFGELVDYNGDYEHRYCCSSKWVDNWGDTDYIEENYAFYIPESSIPQEKQGWYRSHACNTSVYSEYYRNDQNYITPRISIDELKFNSTNMVRCHNELLFTVNELEKIIDLIQDSTVLDSNTQVKTATFLKSYRNVLKERLERLDLGYQHFLIILRQ